MVATRLGRRDFLRIGAGALTGAAALGLAGCGDASEAQAGASSLQFSFWGSSVRAGLTTKAIHAYEQSHPQVKISTWFTGFGSYWPKLATQISGGSAPDLIQMDMRYIDQYVRKGLLLDLTRYIPQPIDLHDFNQPLLKGSEARGKIYGIPFGGNFTSVFYNTSLFQKVGYQMPGNFSDWTWDAMKQVAQEIVKAAGPGVYGVDDASSNITAFEVFIRQRGKELYTDAGQRAFNKQDALDWFGYWSDLRKAGLCIPPDLSVQYSGATPALTTIVAGKAAINFSTSNQIQAFQAATPTKLGLYSTPSSAGVKDNGNYLKASMLLSASSSTKNPDAVTQFINAVFNDPALVKALKIERGIPGSARAQALLKPSLKSADLKQLTMVNQLAAITRPKSVLDPPGAGEVSDLLVLIAQGLGFGKMSIDEAASTLVTQADKALERDGV
ncbi:ABC transporter substrate-binding protein [Dictyobacter aurantiacus]|nr:extracellular solute-binding protein [Dictyobacter aurantiacus]